MTECKVREFSLGEEAKQSQNQAEQVFQHMARKGVIEPVRLGLYFKEVAKEMGVKVAEPDIGWLLLEYGDLMRKASTLALTRFFNRHRRSSASSLPQIVQHPTDQKAPTSYWRWHSTRLVPNGVPSSPKFTQEYRLIEQTFGTCLPFIFS